MTHAITYLRGAHHVLLQGEGLDGLLAAVSGARMISYKDEGALAVPHTFANTMTLRALHVDVEQPINFGDYTYRGRFSPYAHQKVTAAFMATHKKLFCFNSLGTGKTGAALWAADYLMLQGAVRKALIVAPLTTLSDVWAKEIFNVVVHRRCAIVHGTREQRAAALAQDVDFYIVNSDGVKTVYAALVKRSDINLIIIDECTSFKTPDADRTKAMSKTALMHDRRVWAMTGTPMAQLPTDIYSMAKVICPERLPQSLSMFRDQTCVKVSTHVWKPKRDAVAKVMEALHPMICFKKEDCLDLPPVVTINRACPPDAHQKRIISDFTTKFVTEMEGKKVTAINAAVLLSKVLQVLGGVLITNSQTGDGSIFGAPSRIAVVNELVDASESKSIVFAPFRFELDYLEEELKHHGVVRIDGSVGLGQRNQRLDRFASDPSVRVLIAHPRTTSHGLTLTSASTIIWYGPVFSAETYIQAVNRIDRPGQKHSMVVAHLIGHPIEQKIYDSVSKRLFTQGQLIDLVADLTGERAL